MFKRFPRVATAAALALVVSGAAAVSAQRGGQATLPLEPQRERGSSVTPAFEGWYQNPDGSYSLLIGYYNRNSKEAIDIPVGPNNHVDPGGPDRGQPTHFEIGRQWGVFAIKVPKDWGTKPVTWTIVSNGEEQSIPFTLNKGYPITPFKELGMGNQPPVLAFADGGDTFTGPPVSVAASFNGAVKQPIALNVWVKDPKPTAESAEEGAAAGRGRGGSSFVASVSFHKFRGPGKVTFDKARITVPQQGAMVTANATFDTPGEYLLRVQANDESGEGGGGFQCCWTNTYVKVTVR